MSKTTYNYSYQFIDINGLLKNIDYLKTNILSDDRDIENLDMFIPNVHIYKRWIKSTSKNSFVDKTGIFKNRFDEITEFRYKPNLSSKHGTYMVDRIYSLSQELDKLNIPFNLIQVEEMNKNYSTEYFTYIMFKTKNDLAKFKLLCNI